MSRLVCLGPANGVELDPGSPRAEGMGDSCGDRPKLLLHVARLQERARDLGEQGRLPSFPFGLSLSVP